MGSKFCLPDELEHAQNIPADSVNTPSPSEEEIESETTSLEKLFLSKEWLSDDGSTCTIELVGFNTNHPLFNLLITPPHGTNSPDRCVLKRLIPTKHRAFNREVAVLMQVEHPHIVKYFGHMQQPDGLFIFQEYCCGGSLLDLIRRSAPLPDEQVARLTAQLIEALEYLHNLGIVHRDVKPANIMLVSPKRDQLVLIDFGQARKIAPTDEFRDWAGTPAFMAPECTRERTGEELKKMDMWAVGICVYFMLTKRLPFRVDAGLQGLMRDVCQKNVVYPESISKTTKSFLKGLLKRESSNRLSASEALRHKWISNHHDTAVEEEYPDPEVMDDLCVATGGIDIADW